jgi:hypothetical protein
MTKRSDTGAAAVQKKVNVTTLVEPAFLTLTDKPANQVGFKIIREDNKEQNMTEKTADIRVRRVRAQRSMGPMVSVMFPAGTTEDDAKKTMDEFGLTGYTLTRAGDSVVALRSDLEAVPANVTNIGIGNGVFASIERADPVLVAGEKGNLSVVAVRFDKEQYSEESDVMAWIERHDIDFLPDGVKNGPTATLVCRTGGPDGEETREIQVEDGVTFVIARADLADVPSAFIEVVSETSYGSWGWGQLDFASCMADKEFCNAAEEAGYTLRRVADQILFYSPLPVSVRKELVSRAATQYATYMGSLLDALPAKVVLANRSIHESKESQVTDKKQDEVQRSDAAAAVAAPTTPTVEHVTRAELVAVVAEAVKAAMATVQRTDSAAPAAAEAAPVEAAPAAAAVSAEATHLENVTRSLEALAKTVAGMAEGVDSRLGKIEGATVLRSDAGDAPQTVTRKDVFKGMFPSVK